MTAEEECNGNRQQHIRHLVLNLCVGVVISFLVNYRQASEVTMKAMCTDMFM